MDTANGIEQEQIGGDLGPEPAIGEAAFDLGGDERRMHVRAYNHWVSLLKGRPYPPIDELDPAGIADFGAHSVLLDFSGGLDDPAIAFLGTALREECGLGGDIRRIADVPGRSLLSRLTDHYLQIIANRAPIGFEAEFVGTRGRTTLYRGILMPFSSNGEAIDFIYGVINWKELADAPTQASLAAELDAAMRDAPARSDTPIWGEPGMIEPGTIEPVDAPAMPVDAAAALLSGSLGERLALARESAAQVRASDARSRSALYRALGRAHDFALAAEADAAAYRAILDDAGLTVQARAPMTPIVKLVFGSDHDKTRLTEFAAVLAHARRHDVAAGALPGFVERAEGGIKGIVAAERRARRPAPASGADAADPIAGMRGRSAIGTLALPAEGAEFVVLLARANEAGGLDVIARTDAANAVAMVMRRAA